jgi:hypothetical protein
MKALEFAAALVAATLAATTALAQPPVWAGGPIPPGQIYGYSPLVPTIDPFPTKTSPYAPSIFGPFGGRRVYPQLVVNPRRPAYRFENGSWNSSRVPTGTNLANLAPAEPVVTTAFAVGPVVQPLPVTGLQRFGR